MNRSRDGPARSLLNSFTVATTPPPSATVASRLQETETNTTASESGVATPSAAGPSPFAVGSSENVDEEPHPSFVAPQPAPAPAPWAAAAAAAERSADRADSTAPPGLLTSSWSAAWRPSTHSRRLLSATSVSNAASGALHDARSTPFKWRSAALEVPPHTPTWQPQRLRARVGDAGGGRLETERDSSRLTPKIRYRSASSSAERPSSANSQLLTTGTLDSAPRRSSSVGGGYGSRAPRLDSTRDVVAGDGGGAADGWLSNRERTAPALSSATAWQPITAAAAGGGGAGGEARARETPRGATGLPTLLRTRLNSVAATIGFTANHSDATETHSDPSSATAAAAAASHTRPLLSSWYAPAATPAAVSEGFQVKEDDEGLRAGGQRVASQEAWHHPHRQPQPAVSPRKSSGGGSPPVVTSEASVNNRSHSGAAVETGPVPVGDDGCLDDDAMTAAAVAAAGPVTLAHLTLRSLTEEYNHFSSEGTVGWVGLQVHLRRHTQSTQITSLDLTCYRMRREQWSWFALDILPQLHSIEVLRLVQMQLGDDEVAELVRGSCGFAGHGGSPRVLPSSSPTPSPTAQRSPRASASAPPSSLSSHAAAPVSSATSGPPHSGTALRLLRVLDLSGNAITQRSCNHLGKMMLWMADSLEEVRLLGNALKDYGMQTLSIYVAKLNVETLQRDPELFPGALRHQLRLALRRPRTHGHPSSLESAGGAAGTAPPALGELPIGPLLLDVRDCRASARGLSDILAAASRAHRLQAVIVSHNVAGVSALLPLPAAAYQEALDVASGTRAAETEDGPSPRARTYRLGPAPRRLRLVKTPLIASGALMRRQQAAFSEVRGFAPECALSTLVFHSVPLSQTCSPVGCRELLLNVFFSCPYLDLLDLSDTFEWLLVPPEEQQGLVREASHRDAVEQRLRGPEVQRGLQMYKEDQGETEFVLDSATVAGQTRLGDIFGELMAHAAYNAVVRQRVVPAAFAHLRELHLSNTGLTDAGVRGLCVSVRRDRARTGMLAGLTVLNLSDNLLTVRGCVRVVASFLLEEGDGHHPSVAHLTALALQRNAGVLEGGEEGERGGDSSSGGGFPGDPLAGYITDGAGDEAAPSRLQSYHERASNAYLREVCTAAEGAVLRRATLRSATHAATAGDDGGAPVPALTVYFSAPPSSAVGRRESREEACDAAWGGVDVNGHAARGPHLRSRLSPLYGASVPVYYAGCDERGDIFCTCPRSRFYVPRGTAVGGASSEAAPVGRTPAAGAFPQRGDIPRTAAAPGGGPFAQGRPPTSPPEAFPVASRRRLLSALDVPLTPSHVLHGSGSSALTPPDVRLPPSLLLGGGMQARAGQALAGTPVQHDIHLSSVSFPPPSSASTHGGAGGTKTAVSPHHWVDRPPAAPPASQLFSLSVPLSSRRESTLSGTGASLGSLFMDRAESAREEEVSEETAATAAAAAVPPADTAEMAEQSVADDLAAAPRSGKRRAKIRAMRTFILSYDHPPGHLLCRVLGVLLRPAPDALGEGARAALAQDLLAALQRACARAAAYPDGEDSTADDASLSSPRPAATVEAVRYLPAAAMAEASSPASSLSASAATEPHWMRFEITTNERKPRMAQRLQEVLNVSWAAQCVRFANLLQWLRAHVVEEVEDDTPRAKAAGGVAAWDPVQAVERVARAVPAVQARLESRYGGSAATAVHAHHMDASAATANGTGAGATSASRVVTLAELHPLLWRELGLTEDGDGGSGGEREEAEEVEDGTAASASVTKDNVSSMPVSTLTFRQAIDSTTTKGRAEEGERATEVPGEDMYTALSASENPSRGSNGEEKAESAEEEADGGAGVGGHAASQPLTVMKRRPEKEMPPVVDLYGDANASMEELKATQRPSELTRRAEEDVTVTSTPEKEAGSTGRGQGTGVGIAIAALSLASPLSAKAALSDPQASAEAAGQSSKTIRRFEAISTSEDEEEDEDDEKATSGRGGGGTQSGGTPEKQQRQGAPSPLAAEATPSMPEGPLEVRRGDGDVLTDQLMGPPSPESDRVLRQRPVTTATPAAEVAAGASAEAPTPFGERWPQEEKERRSISGTSAGSRGREGTRSDSPSSPGSRQRSAAAQHSAAPPSPRYTDVEVEDDSVNTPLAQKQRAEEEKEKERETEDGEEDAVILSPVRVQRHPSALEGRVKTFTLSYTHQEGTAVCRAWRLLHAPVSAADATTGAEVPPSPSFAALAQEARDCLCDDFLALLQPPDEDMKHVVLSVVLQSDGGGAATAMLQVQVQTNERRATLANRLQESTHGLRRGVPTAAGVANGGGGRGGLVPLTVEQADRFYFPRLSRLLRRHQTAADTVAQLDRFLQSRPTVQSRLLRSYGSLGALVHYYHGSAMALEHELGVASWDELVRGPRPAPMAALAEAAQEASTGLAGSASRLEISSPTVANDRVMPRSHSGDVHEGEMAAADARSSGGGGGGAAAADRPHRRRRSVEEADGEEAGVPLADTADPQRRSASSPLGGSRKSSGVARPLPAMVSGPLQGRPPPHPRRPPTPPHPITHSDSISFDEITEEPTSEAGPVVVLRGSTPSAAARSPSTPNSRNPQYFPAGFRDGSPAPSSPAAAPGGRGRQAEAFADPSALSPLTSASASPVMAAGRPSAQPSLEGSRSGREGQSAEPGPPADVTLSPMPQTPQRGTRERAGGHDAPPPPPRHQPVPAPADPRAAPPHSLSSQPTGSPTPAAGKSEYERVLEGKYKRLMRVSYDGVARGSVPLDPQHQQKTVIGRGKWGTQRVELSLEWEILFVLTFEKSRTLGRSSRRAQMIVHPVGCGFECVSGDELSHQAGGGGAETSSLRSSMVNAMAAEGSGAFHPPGATASQVSRGSRNKRDGGKSAASHLIITIQRPFGPDEVGSSMSEMEKTLMAGALLTVSSASSLSKAARLLTGSATGDDGSVTSRGSAGTPNMAQDVVSQLCQRNLTLDIEMKSAKHVQEALRLLKNSIRRATQAVRKSMQNAHIPPPAQ